MDPNNLSIFDENNMLNNLTTGKTPFSNMGTIKNAKQEEVVSGSSHAHDRLNDLERQLRNMDKEGLRIEE